MANTSLNGGFLAAILNSYDRKDTLQRAEQGLATDKTIRAIYRGAKNSGFMITPADLIKNPPQKPQKPFAQRGLPRSVQDLVQLVQVHIHTTAGRCHATLMLPAFLFSAG
jgi:hypothetical protein